MAEISIIYFSGTGNTWWTSKKIAESLESKGHICTVLSVENSMKTIQTAISKSDIILTGYPVYGSDRPEIIKDFIKTLPEAGTASNGSRQAFGIFCTQLIFSGDGAWLENTTITEKGYHFKWAFHLRMPNNISVSGIPLPYTNNPEKITKRLEKTGNRIKRIAGLISSGTPYIQGRGSFWKMMGNMQRKPFRRMYERLRDDLSINTATCTKCGKCTEICPADNISIKSGDNYPEFSGKCILCLRCYNFCPLHAIMYRGHGFIPGKPGKEMPYRGPIGGMDPRELKI